MSKARQFIKDFTKHCINIIEGYDDAQNPVIDYYPWITPDQALRAVEIAREELIEGACKWLKENKDHPFIKCEDPCLSGYLTDEFIEYFKKAMVE